MREWKQERKASWGKEGVGGRGVPWREDRAGRKRRYSAETNFFAYKVKWNQVVKYRLASPWGE